MGKFAGENLFEEMNSAPANSGHIIRVAFESGVDSEFDYLVPDKLWPITVGQRIEAPFGKNNKLEIGFCVETSLVSPQVKAGKKKFKLKTISDIVDKSPLLDAGLMELARWISDYYVCPLGVVLGAMVPGAVKKGAGEKKKKYVYIAVGPEEIDKAEGEIKGKKQKQIFRHLRNSNAFEPETSVEIGRASCRERVLAMV
jgi:primosomal protein N' (replication factor Y)